MSKTIRNVARGLVLLSVVGMSLPVFAGDAAAGKDKSMLCAGCHGANGISISPNIPNLAGQKEAYLAKAINDFKSGARKDGMMSSVASGIADADVADIAAYFASLK